MQFVFIFELYFLFYNFFFQFLKNNLIDDSCSYPCKFFEFGLHFSNLHINLYYVFDVNFE
jgi:hypothetical protein